MLANDIMEAMEILAPEQLADSWDNTGLQIGSKFRKVQKILVSLDLEKNAVEKAIDESCDMIITHHPFFFGDIKRLSTDGTRGEIIKSVIKSDITVYSAHTNLDIARDGMNRILAEKLELSDVVPISPTYSEELYKVAVYVPKVDSERLRAVLGKAGAGNIGNYEYCSFTVEGMGRFSPIEGANPHIGRVGSLEEVIEEKIEVISEKRRLKKVIDAMKESHPYEEVAYDVYRLENEGEKYGYGGIGNLEKSETLESFAKQTKEKLGCSEIKVYGDIGKRVEKVAFCGGSGASFIEKVAGLADVYVTGDIKYHDAQKAVELGLALIDGGHFGTEKHIIECISSFLKGRIGSEVEIIPFEYDFSEHTTF